MYNFVIRNNEFMWDKWHRYICSAGKNQILCFENETEEDINRNVLEILQSKSLQDAIIKICKKNETESILPHCSLTENQMMELIGNTRYFDKSIIETIENSKNKQIIIPVTNPNYSFESIKVDVSRFKTELDYKYEILKKINESREKDGYCWYGDNDDDKSENVDGKGVGNEVWDALTELVDKEKEKTLVISSPFKENEFDEITKLGKEMNSLVKDTHLHKYNFKVEFDPTNLQEGVYWMGDNMVGFDVTEENKKSTEWESKEGVLIFYRMKKEEYLNKYYIFSSNDYDYYCDNKSIRKYFVDNEVAKSYVKRLISNYTNKFRVDKKDFLNYLCIEENKKSNDNKTEKNKNINTTTEIKTGDTQKVKEYIDSIYPEIKRMVAENHHITNYNSDYFNPSTLKANIRSSQSDAYDKLIKYLELNNEYDKIEYMNVHGIDRNIVNQVCSEKVNLNKFNECYNDLYNYRIKNKEDKDVKKDLEFDCHYCDAEYEINKNKLHPNNINLFGCKKCEQVISIIVDKDYNLIDTLGYYNIGECENLKYLQQKDSFINFDDFHYNLHKDKTETRYSTQGHLDLDCITCPVCKTKHLLNVDYNYVGCLKCGSILNYEYNENKITTKLKHPDIKVNELSNQEEYDKKFKKLTLQQENEKLLKQVEGALERLDSIENNKRIDLKNIEFIDENGNKLKENTDYKISDNFITITNGTHPTSFQLNLITGKCLNCNSEILLNKKLIDDGHDYCMCEKCGEIYRTRIYEETLLDLYRLDIQDMERLVIANYININSYSNYKPILNLKGINEKLELKIKGESKMKQVFKKAIDVNKQALINSSKQQVGQIVLNKSMQMIGSQLPENMQMSLEKYKPIIKLLLANLLMLGVESYPNSSNKLKVLAEATVNVAMQDNIAACHPEMIFDLLIGGVLGMVDSKLLNDACGNTDDD